MKMKSVAINGYGTIGKRVADAVAAQDDMKVIGVSKTRPNYEARTAIEEKGYPLYIGIPEREQMFKDAGINIQKADIPFVKVLISDSKEMMHTYTKFSEDKREVIPETAIGIWNKYEDVARNYDERFMNQLEKIKRKQKK